MSPKIGGRYKTIHEGVTAVVESITDEHILATTESTNPNCLFNGSEVGYRLADGKMDGDEFSGDEFPHLVMPLVEVE